MTKYRKAIAAFVTPLLGLPFVAWIVGDAAFDWGTIGAAIVSGITAAAVFIFPNDSVVQ